MSARFATVKQETAQKTNGQCKRVNRSFGVLKALGFCGKSCARSLGASQGQSFDPSPIAEENTGVKHASLDSFPKHTLDKFIFGPNAYLNNFFKLG